MKHAIVNKILSKDETKISYKIEIIKMDGNLETDRFRIPFVHAGDGEAERGYIKTSIKATNKSKYMPFTFGAGGGCYQTSYKK